MTTPRIRKLVPSSEEGQGRLDTWLSRTLSIPRAQAKKAILQGHVTLDGKPLKASDCPQPGSAYTWLVPEEKEARLIPKTGPLDIRYEDPWLLVVSKPQGQLTHPVRPGDTSSLASALAAYTDLADLGDPLRPGIVHRLDKDTSGLLVVAKDKEAGLLLREAIGRKEVDRRYLALSQGRPKERDFVIANYLVKNPQNPLKREVKEEGEEGLWAQTSVHLLYYNRDYSALSCRLHTGRTHQIRVHLAHWGLPIVGDPLYGQARNPFGFQGQALHAHYLAFTHPITGVCLQIRCPFPTSFRHALQRLAYDYRKEEGL